MKLSIVLMFVTFFTLSANESYSQKTKINLNYNNISFGKLIDEIESTTEFQFVYKLEDVDLSQIISVDAKNKKIAEILENILAETKTSFNIDDRQVYLIKRENIGTNQSEQSGNLNSDFQEVIQGIVVDTHGVPLAGASIREQNTENGVFSDFDGKFAINISNANMKLVVSYVGFKSKEITVGDSSNIEVILEESTEGLDEILIVGYGSQKKSDVTGSVSSLPKERLEMVPNVNIAQAIQGAVPGMMIQNTSAGAAPNQSLMIRGRNSIKASNQPLIVLDGIPYNGNINDINPNDVASIDVLKDASASAIYGSRGANGVILVTTKRGKSGELSIAYDGYYSIQDYINLPDVMDGAEFYDFKMTRAPEMMTAEEREIYESGNWENWYDLLLRQGNAQQHNISVSGGSEKTTFYVAGSLLDVKGLSINDKFVRFNNRINIDTDIKDWLTIGSKSQFSYSDQSGVVPGWDQAYSMNPLTKAFDEDGAITIYPWEGNTTYANPLQQTLYDNTDKAYQVITNNYVDIDIPFIKGLNYRLNTGFNFSFSDYSEYRGRDTKTGLDARGESITKDSKSSKSVIENILNYNRSFGVHKIKATALYSFEENETNFKGLEASGFPNDFRGSYAASQAESIIPSLGKTNTKLISQMLRVNYSYDSRYLLTLTGRRDGYSGFGANTKWGLFPSVALGWNINRENFFAANTIFNSLKLRVSYGKNGNQAVGAYETLSRLEEYNMVDNKVTQPGYRPSVLGQDDLGWESSSTLNVGLDFGLLKNRLQGTINLYKTRTKDLLLDRTISPVHGIGSTVQNIGETENQGIEFTLNSTNISTNNFSWSTSANFSFIKNEIVSLYGISDENGQPVNDLANAWFVGKPINVIYDHKRIGTWQLNEAEEAAEWGSQPGFVKFEDVNNDGVLDDKDRQILGNKDPDFLWGLSNIFTYKDFGLSVFIHGVHGLYKANPLMTDDTTGEVRSNTITKNWWIPDNPTNEWVKNDFDAEIMGGISAKGKYYEDASYVRLKDVTLFYNLPNDLIEGLSSRVYLTGRNLLTVTNYSGLDPEINNQKGVPMQQELVIGLNLKF
ncbi:TonB-dependent receptor [Zunongwangia endophytica]|uniref:TonB-dependent receptor n=2 Tax=Zunongwangia endophytica TaxID=1808945 RepID=A0ABV8HC98_9FLAO